MKGTIYKDEINYLDVNDEMTYYEVEIWENSDCDGRFFRTLRGAKAFFKSHAKDQCDCIKKHCVGGSYFIIVDNL